MCISYGLRWWLVSTASLTIHSFFPVLMAVSFKPVSSAVIFYCRERARKFCLACLPFSTLSSTIESPTLAPIGACWRPSQWSTLPSMNSFAQLVCWRAISNCALLNSGRYVHCWWCTPRWELFHLSCRSVPLNRSLSWLATTRVQFAFTCTEWRNSAMMNRAVIVSELGPHWKSVLWNGNDTASDGTIRCYVI